MSNNAISIIKSINTIHLTKDDCEALAGFFMGVKDRILESEREAASKAKQRPNPNITMTQCNSK